MEIKRDEYLRRDGKMEKITKEELLEKLGGVALSDDELEKVSGGSLSTADRCFGLTGQELLDCVSSVGSPASGELKPGILKDG